MNKLLLGKLIRKLRKDKGLSLRQLAEQISVSFVNISHIENGRVETTEKVIKELFKYAEEEGLEYNEEQFLAAEKTIKTRLKANIAQNLYDYRKFYEIINDLNSSLQEALKILKEGDEFNQLSAN